MVGVEDDHLGRAAGLAARLDDAGEGVEALHEADRAAGDAAARHLLLAAPDGGEVDAGARAVLEQHGLGLGEVHDRAHRVLHGVDEAGRALGPLLHADVEPDGAVEGHLLVDEQVRQLRLEGLEVLVRGEVVLGGRPGRDGVDDPVDELPDAVSRPGVPMWPRKYLLTTTLVASWLQDVGHLDVRLLEDGLARLVGDVRGADLPAISS